MTLDLAIIYQTTKAKKKKKEEEEYTHKDEVDFIKTTSLCV